MSEHEPVREPASSPCQAPPGYWDEIGSDAGSFPALGRLWDRLLRVQRLALVARSANPSGWNGQGSGTVVVQLAGDKAITFTESGSWQPEGGRELRFRNVYRWTLVGDLLRLEHLRFGEDRPVYLFDLEPAGERQWRSVAPHL